MRLGAHVEQIYFKSKSQMTWESLFNNPFWREYVDCGTNQKEKEKTTFSSLILVWLPFTL